MLNSVELEKLRIIVSSHHLPCAFCGMYVYDGDSFCHWLNGATICLDCALEIEACLIANKVSNKEHKPKGAFFMVNRKKLGAIIELEKTAKIKQELEESNNKTFSVHMKENKPRNIEITLEDDSE